MKGDICQHFCQIDQAFFFYHKASESSQGGGAGESSAMSKLGDLYKFQGKMGEAILHYERALTNESNSLSQNQTAQGTQTQIAGLDTEQLDGNKTGQISKIYSETFVKLFVTKGACCDWHQYEWLVEHLKYILL